MCVELISCTPSIVEIHPAHISEIALISTHYPRIAPAEEASSKESNVVKELHGEEYAGER